MIKGIPRFDGIAIGQLSANFNRETLHLEATAGFVDSKTGETHGWTKGDGRMWSKETMQKLLELREAMESDFSRLHFSMTGSEYVGPVHSKAPSGIGEHLATADAPSV
jgi:hypothetical protein